MRWSSGAVLLCISALIPLVSGSSPVREGDWVEYLPVAAGKPLVVTHCSSCHSLEKVVMQRRSEDEWMAVVGKMVGDQGAPISESEFAQIVAYLGSYYSPRPDVGANDTQSGSLAGSKSVDWGMLLPKGPGKQLVLSYCTSCHGLNIIVRARKGREAWFNTITWMTDDLGASIPEQEIQPLVDYLSLHAGEDNPLTEIPLAANSAPVQALERLPFLTQTDIEKLVQYRSRQRFTSLEELSRVLGLSESILRQSRLYLTID